MLQTRRNWERPCPCRKQSGPATVGFARGPHHPRWTQPSLRGSGAREGRTGGQEIYAAFSLPQVPVQSWFDDMADTELLNLIPIFEELSGAEDVYTSLGQLRAP